jgi:hypothetical protein
MKQLLSSSIAAPGFFGLNTQESSVTLSSGFALQADNCVIDSGGRLGARKGYTYQTASGGTGSNIEGIHDFVGHAGHIDYVSWGNNNLYKGIGTLTPLTLPSGYTITGNEWSAASLNNNVYLVQEGHAPLKISSTLTVAEHNQGGGSNHSLPDVSWITTAFGRLFAAGETGDHHTLHVSDHAGDFSNSSSTGAVIDFNEIWTNGGDELISAHGFNGRLVVFSKRCIVILDDGNSTDLLFDTASGSLRVVEILENVGCVSSKSIQIVGDDIYFLSNTGLRSLNRVIQEKSNPLSDLSVNVRDELVDIVTTTTHEEITSVYSASNAFYLLIFPTTKLVYCFDTRGRLENGGLRVTKWIDVPYLSSMSAFNGDLYVGLEDGIGKYTGYQDNGSDYYMAYKTNYFDFDQPTTNKILKTVGVTLIGGSGQNFTIKVGTDYTDQPRSYNRAIKQSSFSEYANELVAASEAFTYGPDTSGETYTYVDLGGVTQTATTVAGDAEYTGGGLTDRVKASVGGQGSVLQLGFEAYISGNQLSIQKFDVYVKQGKTN